MTNNKESTTLLKPCPFCGGDDIHIYQYGAWKNSFVQCGKCSALAPDPATTDYNTDEAIKIWNKRTNRV